MSNEFVFGNAVEEGRQESCYPGWFIGSFVSPALGLRCNGDVEVKWGIHEPNDEKRSGGTNDKSMTLTLLISGSLLMQFPQLNTEVTLQRPGDYVLFAPKVQHRWRSLSDSVVVTVRWPSLPPSAATGQDPS